MKKVRKHRCSKCDNIAVWLYMPSNKGRVFFCDNCVPRGCSCNVDNIKEFGEPTNQHVMWWSKDSTIEDLDNNGSLEKSENSFYYEILDDENRRSPCCEFEYDEDGYDIEDNIYYVSSDDAFNAITSSYMKGYMNSPYWMIETDTYNYFSTKCIDFLMNHTKGDIIEYNKFMNYIRGILTKMQKLDFNYNFNRADECFANIKECLIHKKFLKNG